MTQIFVSHSSEDAECAEQIRLRLEAKGYNVWREPPTLSLKSVLYTRTVNNAIIGSATVILVWSGSATQSEWVERHILLAQRLKKPIVPVVLDGIDPPNTLTVDHIIVDQAPCADVAAKLMPHLPAPGSNDPIIALWEQASHDSLISINARKTAIEQASDMLKQQNQPHREAILALLEYLAQHDLMTGVRDKANAVLQEDAKKVAQIPPPPFLNPDDSRHIFAVRCNKGHITYFDKRRVCVAQGEGIRKHEEVTATKLQKLVLKCKECGEELPVSVDCEGYNE